tara:strand:+ start:71 stop:478 length:408 start_codon:yes stop_codon:yes gene_type:complete
MKKYIITFFIGFIASVVIGIIPGILFYGPKQAEFSKLYPGVVNETPEPLFMLISGIAILILWIISFDKMGIHNLKDGATTGIWYGALFFTFFGFQFIGITKIVSLQFVLTDILISSLIGAFQGSAIAWSLGKFRP